MDADNYHCFENYYFFIIFNEEFGIVPQQQQKTI